MITSRAKKIQEHCNSSPLRPVAVELGIGDGSFSKEILQAVPAVELIGVDPYVPFNIPSLNASRTFKDCDNLCRQAIIAYGPYPHCKVYRLPAIMVSEFYNNGFLDFIYIDPISEYFTFKEILERWIPKVKTGGIIGIYRYTANYPDVMNTVNEVFSGSNIEEIGEVSPNTLTSVFIKKH